jgi:hypothetical protein
VLALALVSLGALRFWLGIPVRCSTCERQQTRPIVP